MSDFLLIEDDQVIFDPLFGVASVVVQPGTLKGSAKETLNMKKLCLQGDESNVAVSGCMYTTPIYSIAGTGVLKIKRLAGNQISQKKFSDAKSVLLKGDSFIAVFQVQVPAQKPATAVEPPQPDATSEYIGSGRFLTTNTKWQAS